MPPPGPMSPTTHAPPSAHAISVGVSSLLRWRLSDEVPQPAIATAITATRPKETSFDG